MPTWGNKEQLFNKVFSLLMFSVNFSSRECLLGLHDPPGFFQVDRASLKATAAGIGWFCMFTGVTPFLVGFGRQRCNLSIDAPEKSKTTTKNWIWDYLEAAQNTSEYEEKLQTLWGCSGISMKLLDHLFGTRLAVQNCGELSQYLAHIV